MKRIESGPNFARYAIGALTIVALRDGYVDMPPSRLRQEDNRPFEANMPAQVALVDGRLRLSVNAFLVVDQGQYTLIDTGAANAWEPTMGLLLGALDEARVARADIQTVAFTHTHTDHVGGLVAADGSDAFPKLKSRGSHTMTGWHDSIGDACHSRTVSLSAAASPPCRQAGTRSGIQCSRWRAEARRC